MTVLRAQVWLLAVRRAVFSCPNLSLSGVYKKTPEGLWASRQVAGWFEVSSRKETLHWFHSKTNLGTKTSWHFCPLPNTQTSHYRYKQLSTLSLKKKKKWTHVNETPLAPTSTWLAVIGGEIRWGLNSWFTGLSSEPCPVRGRESTEQEKWMTLVAEGSPYGRQRSEAFRPPSSHLRRAAAKVTKKKVKIERERYSPPPPPNIASHPRFKLTWAEETVRETFESLDGEWVFTLEQTAAVKRWRLGAVVSLLGLTDSTNLTLAARYAAQLLGNVSAKWVIQSVTGWSRQCAAVRGVLSCPLSATLPPLPVLAPQHSPRAPTDKPTRRVSIWWALLLVRDKVKSMQPGDDETATIVRTAPPRTCGNFPFFLCCHRSSSSSLGIAGSPPWMEPSLIPPLLLRRVTWTRTRNHVFSTNTRTCRLTLWWPPKIDVLRRLVGRFKVLEESKATPGTKTEKDNKVPCHFEVFLKCGMLRRWRGDGRFKQTVARATTINFCFQK